MIGDQDPLLPLQPMNLQELWTTSFGARFNLDARFHVDASLTHRARIAIDCGSKIHFPNKEPRWN